MDQGPAGGVHRHGRGRRGASDPDQRPHGELRRPRAGPVAALRRALPGVGGRPSRGDRPRPPSPGGRGILRRAPAGPDRGGAAAGGRDGADVWVPGGRGRAVDHARHRLADRVHRLQLRRLRAADPGGRGAQPRQLRRSGGGGWSDHRTGLQRDPGGRQHRVSRPGRGDPGLPRRRRRRGVPRPAVPARPLRAPGEPRAAPEARARAA
jgi:hypothetical protein